MMSVKWNKCIGDAWCSLGSVNINHAAFDNVSGIYIIWHGGTTPWTVYVGSGVIRDRLLAARHDSRIQNFSGYGLYVTWAAVSKDYVAGMCAYLQDKLKPRVLENPLMADRIEVSLPW